MVDQPELGIDDVNGVGTDKADALREAGYETVQDLAEADPADIEPVPGFGSASAPSVIESASKMVAEPESVPIADTDADSESSSDGDTQEEEPVETTDTAPAPELLSDGSYEVTLPAERDVLMFATHAVIEEAISRHQSNSFDTRESAFDIAEKLMAATTHGGGIDVNFTSDEMDLLYVALNQGWQDYASRPGITQIWEEIQTLSTDVNDSRTA